MTMDSVADAPYRDAARSVDERVADLLGRMTLDEKVGQLGSIWVFEVLSSNQFSEEKARPLMRHGLGQVTRVAGASSLDPTGAARLANTIQQYLIDHTRLGIPALVHEECCSGFMARNATCFPQIIGVASTWAPDLVEALARVVRVQMRAAGAQQGLSPVLDVCRDPRWGRVEETFGEDPYLVARMGVSFVRGLQGDDLHTGVLATAKHFVGYGVSEGGMNWAPPHIPERELREVYLHPFEAAVREAKLASVMNGYHELDGVPCGAAHWLLTETLRQDWGFDGTVVSDYFAVNQLMEYHQLATSKEDAAALALRAGIDVELPSTDCYGDPVRRAVQEGMLAESVIDQTVARILRQKFELGLFEKPFVDPDQTSSVFDTPEQRALAREIAHKSMVLLKNEGDLLPLDKEIGSLAVIGPNADSVRNIIGDYAYPAHIETLVAMGRENPFGTPLPDSVEMVDTFVPITSLLDGIRQKVSAQTQIHYAKGCEVLGDATDGFDEAVEAARRADVALVFVGGKSGLTRDCTCGESRDRADLGLTGMQQQLVEAVVATGTPVVVVLVNGRPLALPWIAEHVPAVLEAWLPAEEGAAAVADLLFGDVNPSGKLPISIPRHVGQIPVYYRHKRSGGRSHWQGDYVEMPTTPLYPFGHGLSYTQFSLDNFKIDRAEAARGETVAINVEITNTGRRAGEEVVQLYTRDPVAGVTRPVQELQGFARVALAPGERKRVTFQLAVNQLGFYDRQMHYVVEPGTIEVMIGTSSDHLPLAGEFTITGNGPIQLGDGKAFFSTATVV